MTCHYIFSRGETYISIVYLYIQHYMFNYSKYIIINRNILFNAIVTRMNKYIIIIIIITGKRSVYVRNENQGEYTKNAHCEKKTNI